MRAFLAALVILLPLTVAAQYVRKSPHRPIATPSATAGYGKKTAGERPNLIVAITFDDTFDDQYTNAAPVLEAHGMKGTFYVNSGRIDVPAQGYLTTAMINDLAARGHEIGHHGLTHQHLEQVMTDQMRRELCDGRADLLSRGWAIKSTAYPFGGTNAGVLTRAAACGFLSARDSGGLNNTAGYGGTSASCQSCPYAEPLPPANAAQVRNVQSLTNAYTLSDAENEILNAESHGGGLLPLTLHHVCTGSSLACDATLAWSHDNLSSLLDWLQLRSSRGTVVWTMSQAIPGPVKASVSSGTPTVINGDFESWIGGTSNVAPDCWQKSGSGTNTRTYGQVTGRTGFAASVVMSAFTSGRASLIQGQGTAAGRDYKSCTTPVTPGHSYTISCWYQADVAVVFSVYETDSTNYVYTLYQQTSSSPLSVGTWAQKTFSFTAAAGWQDISYGLGVLSVCGAGCIGSVSTATLWVDDCTVVDNG